MSNIISFDDFCARFCAHIKRRVELIMSNTKLSGPIMAGCTYPLSCARDEHIIKLFSSDDSADNINVLRVLYPLMNDNCRTLLRDTINSYTEYLQNEYPHTYQFSIVFSVFSTVFNTPSALAQQTLQTSSTTTLSKKSTKKASVVLMATDDGTSSQSQPTMQTPLLNVNITSSSFACNDSLNVDVDKIDSFCVDNMCISYYASEVDNAGLFCVLSMCKN